jgi:hypothetical protein
MRAFYLAVLFGLAHRYKLMANTLRSQGLFKGVRLLYMREEDIGELHTMVSLHLLDREGKGTKEAVKEKDAGLRGEFRADPGRLKASTIVNGGVKVLLRVATTTESRLKGLGAVPETQGRQVFHIHLNSLAGSQHGVALGLFAGSGAAFLHQTRPLQYPVDSKDAEAVAILRQIISQTPGTIVGGTPQGQEPLHSGFGNSTRVAVGTPRAILKDMEVPTSFLIPPQPLIEGLAADPVMEADLGYWDTSLMHLNPGQPLLNDVPCASLHVGDLLLGTVSYTLFYLRVSPMFHNTTFRALTAA